jgi:hypothetical protein
MSISVTDARSLFTKRTIAVYKEMPVAKGFLRSLFTASEGNQKLVSIEVQRGTEKIAPDVLRGTVGNRLKFTQSTEKMIMPPMYAPYFVANDNDLYDVAIGQQNPAAIATLADQTAMRIMATRSTIERAYELQCSQALTTGIVTLNNQDNIDFKRKAASLVDTGAGTYWATGTVSPYLQLEEAGNFLRQVGKADGGTFNVVMGSSAFQDFMNNTIVKERADIRSFSLDVISGPLRNAQGGVLHGNVSAGSYRFNIWTYPEFYDNDLGVSTPYIDPKKIIVIPEAPKFELAYAGVPILIGQAPQRGAYVIQEFLDERATSHEIHVKSAGVAVPVAIDQIYTRKVVA